MEKRQEQLETLREIRTLMERSSRFLSLSGLTGVIAGITAIVGIAAAYMYMDISPLEAGYYRLAIGSNGEVNKALYIFVTLDASIVFIVSLLAALLLSRRDAKKDNLPTWDNTAKRLVINLAIPLLAGGLYCFTLLYHRQIAFIAPATLIFYGMALLNASKYTLSDIRYLGINEILTGLLAAVFIDYGLLFWAFGFGILHIVYGIVVYFKYGK